MSGLQNQVRSSSDSTPAQPFVPSPNDKARARNEPRPIAGRVDFRAASRHEIATEVVDDVDGCDGCCDVSRIACPARPPHDLELVREPP
jgi:hypothetical protein